MKKCYQYPVGTNDECAEAKVFNRLVRHYAWKKFRVGAFAILLLGVIAFAPDVLEGKNLPSIGSLIG